MARRAEELRAQEALFPAETVIGFTEREAAVAARLYAGLRRARGREIDLAIAATAVVQDAALWTLHRGDFDDLPQVRLWSPRNG